MSKAGCPYDNAPMERFYNTFKSSFYNVTSMEARYRQVFIEQSVAKKVDQYRSGY